MKKIVNTTPHDITMTDLKTGEVYSVPPCGTLINATSEEEEAGTHVSGAVLVKVKFKGDEKNLLSLVELERQNPGAIIIGSMVAAQGFPGRVLAMVPAPGFERVPTSEKRMRDDKFTSF